MSSRYAFLLLNIFVFATSCTSSPVAESEEDVQKPTASLFGEVKFDEHVRVQHNALSVDGKAFQEMSCHPQSQSRPVSSGYLTTDDEQKLELVCIDDYLGGVSLIYQSGSDELKWLLLAQQEADAGEQWDTRSILSRDATGQLKVETLTARSWSDDSTKPETLKCKLDRSAVVWSKDKFVEAPESNQLKISDFKPPIRVASECLDKTGGWAK